MAIACGPQADPHDCPDEVVGTDEDWDPGAVPAAAVPECTETVPTPVGLCVSRGDDDLPRREQFETTVEGEIAELGTGELPPDCWGLNTAGTLYAPDMVTLAVPLQDLRWIRVDTGSERWTFALAAPDDTTALEVGDRISASVAWTWGPGLGRMRLELRDEAGGILWWFDATSDMAPIEHAPACVPIRLGAPVCDAPSVCGRAQHHALEIDGHTLAPGDTRVYDDLRFTHGAASFGHDPTCSDPFGAWRVIAATRED